jgi:hypothetical protein
MVLLQLSQDKDIMLLVTIMIKTAGTESYTFFFL